MYICDDTLVAMWELISTMLFLILAPDSRNRQRRRRDVGEREPRHVYVLFYLNSSLLSPARLFLCVTRTLLNPKVLKFSAVTANS